MTIRRLKGSNRKTGCCRLGIDGDMTIYQAGALKDELLANLEGSRDLQLDLSEVTGFDSAGVQLLLMLATAAREHDQRFCLLRASDPVLDVLRLYRVEERFLATDSQGAGAGAGA